MSLERYCPLRSHLFFSDLKPFIKQKPCGLCLFRKAIEPAKFRHNGAPLHQVLLDLLENPFALLKTPQEIPRKIQLRGYTGRRE